MVVRKGSPITHHHLTLEVAGGDDSKKCAKDQSELNGIELAGIRCGMENATWEGGKSCREGISTMMGGIMPNYYIAIASLARRRLEPGATFSQARSNRLMAALPRMMELPIAIGSKWH